MFLKALTLLLFIFAIVSALPVPGYGGMYGGMGHGMGMAPMEPMGVGPMGGMPMSNYGNTIWELVFFV